jgi:hypothetical protein
MKTDNFYFYLQNRQQTSQAGGQLYSDTSPFSIPCRNKHSSLFAHSFGNEEKSFIGLVLRRLFPLCLGAYEALLADGSGLTMAAVMAVRAGIVVSALKT